MRTARWYSVAVATLLLMTASYAMAAEREIWVGRDTEDNSVFWTCTNTSGDNWTLKKNGASYGTYVTTESTSAYIEVKAGENRIRLYSDKMMANEPNSNFKFFTMAKGKWGQ